MNGSLKERPACNIVYNDLPKEIECPKCGHVYEIWKDETELKCSECDNLIKV
ncbi:MAG: hypothetical protein HQK91_13380 [Nitrospirae bacterium]|nr:hypothetical protein [Nitrospirota bacterium]MBF0542429.1 hypothetical protein [Nitrospirota bacterium]